MKNKIFISLLPFETKRLIIRKTSVDDVNMLLKMDRQEETQKYLGGIKNKTREERIAFIEKKLEKFDKGLAGQLTVCLKDGTSIGLIGLNIREENNTGEIGYIFDYDYGVFVGNNLETPLFYTSTGTSKSFRNSEDNEK